ncbi:MAG: DUF748 domain-containing protein [Bacteroidia bacterium]|nr:DUF748 domain-containing protein [Bacteroidia bacterium]
MKKALLLIFIFLLILAGAVVLAYLNLPQIAKYEIEKNSLQWTGRKITVGKIDLDMRHGNVNLRDLKIYEAGSDSLFISINDLFVKVDIRQLFKKVYVVDQIRIDTPEIHIEQSRNHFNFDDLVKRFAPDKKDTVKGPPVQYFVRNVSISRGLIIYENKPLKNVFRIQDLNFNLPEFCWNAPESQLHLDFKYGKEGKFNLDLEANRNTLAYNASLLANNYDISQYYAPLNTILNISSLQGTLTAKLRIHGRFNHPEAMSFHGFVNLYNLEVKDAGRKPLLSLRRLSLDVDSVDPEHNHFDVNHFILDNPKVNYDQYKNGNNFSRIIVHSQKPAPKAPVAKTTKKDTIDYSNIFTIIATSAKAMAIDALHTNYHADSIAIVNGNISFNDYSTPRQFHYDITKLNLVTSELSDLNEGVVFHANAKLGDSGRFVFKAELHFDRKNKKVSGKVDSLKFLNISPIANYVLENNSMKWLGRKVTVGKVNVIMSKGGIFIKDIKIYEPDGKSQFFGCHYVFVKIDIRKLFENKYTVEKIKIDKPDINIVQNGNKFNYDDLLQRFSSDSAGHADTTRHADTAKTAPFPYVVDSVIIRDAKMVYTNALMHHVLKIKNFNFLLPEVRWNKPVVQPHLDFEFGQGGLVSLNMDINRSTLKYHSTLTIDNCDISQYYAPLKAYLNVNSLNGLLSAKLRLHGILDQPANLASSGSITLSNIAITDSADRKVFAFDKLAINIDTINVKQKMYYIRNITLHKPFVLFDYYTEGNNISNMILSNHSSSPAKGKSGGSSGPDYSNIFTLLSSSLSMLAGDFFNTDFHTDSLVIKDGQFLYSDYTLHRDFHFNISHLDLSTDEISNASSNVRFRTSAELNNTGKFDLQAALGFRLKNMLFDYKISKFRLSDINPYMEYYTGVPFEDGYMDYHSNDSVINRYLKSSNSIHITGIEMGNKVNDNPPYHLPIRFAVSLLKNDKGDITINIPASGNLDDPDYKIGKLMGRLLTNLVVKAVESPFKHLADLFNRDPEDMKRIDINYLQDKLNDKQQSKLNDVQKVLKKKKEMAVEITQVADSDAEADDLGLAFAKAMYYRDTKRHMKDSTLTHRQRKKENRAMNKISSDDTLFNNYLNAKLHLTGNELIQVQDKCRMLVGEKYVEAKVHELRQKRSKAVSDYLIHQKNLDTGRVKVTECKDSIKIQNLSQPGFEINYNVKDK